MLKFQRLICRNSVAICGSVKVKPRLRYCSSSVSVNSSEGKSNSTLPPVADFYAGRSVFLTGGTGFLGKVLIERLLYTCQDLDKIYILIREKNGVTVSDRMEEMFRNPVFTTLRSDRPEFLKKVIPLAGDVTLPNLGIKPEDEQTLTDKVSVVIHSAASVKFNNPLPVAMRINFEGTEKVLNLCKRINNIKAFVYISTAFAHTQKQTLEEILYPPPAELSDVYKFIKNFGSKEKETMKFIGHRPNTYTFTKALAESYIAKNHGHVPTIIVRPSGAIKDGPQKGWLENWYGATRALYNVGKGWNRVTLGKKTVPIDLIPVDYVCNLCIVAAARRNKSEITQVINSCTSSENPIMLSDAYRFMIKECKRSGQCDVPYPFNIYTQSKAVLNILIILMHMAPAHIADLFLRIRGKDAKYVKIQLQVTNTRKSMEYFTTRYWVMKSAKARELIATLSQADKLQFPCDPADIKWDEYMKDYCRGMHKYLAHN